jgi:hypothetical protein
MTNSKTAGNSTPGRPFVKGDARINRKGRPRKIDDYRALVQSILNEAATDKAGNALTANGHAMTVIEAMTRQMIQSKNPRMAQIILEYAYGKVPAPVELSGPDGGPVLTEIVIRYADDTDSPNHS